MNEKVCAFVIQILRSSCEWSAGISEVDCSIQNAYLYAIEKSQHFIYIEVRSILRDSVKAKFYDVFVRLRNGSLINHKVKRVAPDKQRFAHVTAARCRPVNLMMQSDIPKRATFQVRQKLFKEETLHNACNSRFSACTHILRVFRRSAKPSVLGIASAFSPRFTHLFA